DVALTQHTDAQQYRIAVAIGPGGHHLQTIAGALSLGPQRPAGAAVERHESSAKGLVQRFSIHKAHHQELAGGRVLNDSGRRALHFVELECHWILLTSVPDFQSWAKSKKPGGRVVRERAWISYGCFLVIRCP